MAQDDFARRLAQACDDLPNIVPPHGYGRQVYFARKLKVSQEGVRKWFAGEARPRFKKMVELAKLLNVDVAWLSYGTGPEMTSKDKKLFNKNTEGVVYLALGLSMLSGGACARPNESDPKKEIVDYYMILGGEQVAVRASLGREVRDNEYEFLVPREYSELRNVGFVLKSASRSQMLDLKNDLIDKHKEKKGGEWAVKVINKAGKFYSGKDQWPRITDIGDLV